MALLGGVVKERCLSLAGTSPHRPDNPIHSSASAALHTALQIPRRHSSQPAFLKFSSSVGCISIFLWFLLPSPSQGSHQSWRIVRRQGSWRHGCSFPCRIDRFEFGSGGASCLSSPPRSHPLLGKTLFGPEICRRNGFNSRKHVKSFQSKRPQATEVEKSIAFADVSGNEHNCAAESHPGNSNSGMHGIADLIGKTRSMDIYERYAVEEAESYLGGDVKSEDYYALDWKTDERVRRSCEAGKNLRVAVLVSGGVDSSVGLRLLCDAGHSCTAFYLKIWFQEDFENFWSACPWEEDLSFAQSVCDEAGVELKVVHLTDAYWAKVMFIEPVREVIVLKLFSSVRVSYMGEGALEDGAYEVTRMLDYGIHHLSSYLDLQKKVSESILEIQAGRTPNPDMLCNSRIKFGEFLEHVKDQQFDRVASGHYACLTRMLRNDEYVTQLHLSADKAKDQTYFLSQLSQDQLSHLMFPLGELSKVEVRKLAEAMGLSNKQRKDSQGICFLGKVKFKEFIARHLGEKEGCLLEAETGDFLGTHKGFWFYTIGQRQGIGLSNGPWFVVTKDVDHNVVFVSRKYYNEKKRRSFRVGSFNWASGSPPSSLLNMQCKVRHGEQFYNCKMDFDTADPNETNETVAARVVGPNSLTAVVNLTEDDQGLAPGQYAAFYQGDVCLGSGIIFEALGEDITTNVSVQALEIAKLCSDPDFLKNQKKGKNSKGSRSPEVGDAIPLLIQEIQEDLEGSLKSSSLTYVSGSRGSPQTTVLPIEEENATERTDISVWTKSLRPVTRFFSWL